MRFYSVRRGHLWLGNVEHVVTAEQSPVRKVPRVTDSLALNGDEIIRISGPAAAPDQPGAMKTIPSVAAAVTQPHLIRTPFREVLFGFEPIT